MEGVAAGAGLGQPSPDARPASHPGSQEPSPYDESDVHDSFHQLIQEQSRWVAEEGLELQERERGAGAPQTTGEPTPPGRCTGAAGGALNLPSLSQLRAWAGDWLGRPPAASPGPPDQSLWFAGSGSRIPPGPEDAGAPSTATLRILASMPSRTIGEWAPLPGPGRLGFQRDLCCVELSPPPRTCRPLPGGPAQPQYSPVRPRWVPETTPESQG